MDFQLLVVRGRSATDVLKLADGVNTVGRHDDCQIRIKSSQVSRRHCELFEKKGLLLVKDLGSSNGTVVNGKKIDGQQVLEPGDELNIGGITLRVAKIGEAPSEKVAAAATAAGDTAVVDAIPVQDDDVDDEFEIDFDDEPASVEAPLAAQENPAPKAKPEAADPKKTAPAPQPAASPAEPELADQAIADFLLDIKLDEDE